MNLEDGDTEDLQNVGNTVYIQTEHSPEMGYNANSLESVKYSFVIC
jgi:hypothetical protein